MANTANRVSYVCSACGVSSDNKEQAVIHANGPLHSGSKFTDLYPDSREALEMKVNASERLLPKK